MLEGCKCDKEKEKVGQSKQELVLWGGSGQQFKEFVRAVGRMSMDLKETGETCRHLRRGTSRKSNSHCKA